MSGETFDDDFEEVEGEEVETEDTEDGLRQNQDIRDLDARRRLEEKIEEHRLKRQLADYDYDFDDI